MSVQAEFWCLLEKIIIRIRIKVERLTENVQESINEQYLIEAFCRQSYWFFESNVTERYVTATMNIFLICSISRCEKTEKLRGSREFNFNIIEIASKVQFLSKIENTNNKLFSCKLTPII